MEAECTPRCRSVRHGKAVTSALSKGEEVDALAYIRHVCCNVTRVVDDVGRNALHVAASCGKSKVVRWLLRRNADANVKDGESGWTALHRSLFYGQLVASKLLVLHGASLQCVDHDGNTPLDLVTRDRLPYIEYSLCNPCDAYVWGTNANFNLGLESQQSKTTPEPVENFKRENVGVKQVVMCTFHTVFLTSDGRVYTCGHGHGGRLGHGNEQTSLIPKQVKALSGEECAQVAAGVDHTVILTSKGAVWTCGLNNCHQLGHNPPPERQLSPKPIKLFHQKGVNITGICAARYHTVVYAKDGVYSFGLNAGHLGHLKGDRTEINPRLISALNLHDTAIDGVIASDGATVCWTDKGDVYVLHEYQCRKVASKHMNIMSVAAIGGHLDFKCDPAMLKERGGTELKILLLTKYGKVFLWTESNPHLTRCLFSLSRQLHVSSLVLNCASVGIVSDKGEGFLGHFSSKHGFNNAIGKTKSDGSHHQKEKKGGKECSENTSLKEDALSPKNNNVMVDLLNKDECYMIRVERMPAIHRGISIASDPKGRNFSVLQSSPAFGLLETIEIARSDLADDFEAFLREADAYDSVHDCTFKVDNVIFPAHKYVVASHSEYCRKLLKETEGSGDNPEIKLDNVRPEMFRQILQFVYTQKCDFLNVGFNFKHLEKTDGNNADPGNAVRKKSNKKAEKGETENDSKTNPLKAMQETAKKFGLKMLVKRMESVKHSNGKITSVVEHDGTSRYSRKLFPELYDVVIETEDGRKLRCHKCILVARSEYFHSMFVSDWIESAGSGFLRLPVTHDVLEVVLDYLYTDEVDDAQKMADVDFAGRVLIVADQLLLKRLKTICESALANMVTLKNVAELLQFSFTYRAEQLQNVCMEFVCINLAAIIETKNLAMIEDETMSALTKRYREMIVAMQCRHITPYAVGPSVEEIRSVASLYPNADDDDDDAPDISSSSPRMDASIKKHKSKRKGRAHRDNSETERANKNEFSVESTEDHSDLDLTSPSPEPLSDSSLTDSSSAKTMPIAIPSPKMNGKVFSKLSFPPLSPSELNGGVPWSFRANEKKSLDLKEIMLCQQQTTQEAKQLLKSTANKTPNAHKKTSKISQKQRKRLTSSTDAEPKSPQFSPDAGIIAHSPTLSAWGNPGNAVHNLKDIMNDQLFRSPPEVNVLPKPSNDVTLTPELSVNPWHRKKSDDAAAVPKFVDILLDEKQNQKPATQPKIKALHLIQMEQQAIEELEGFYKARRNPDERVTVTRILPATSAPPLWKGRRKENNAYGQQNL